MTERVTSRLKQLVELLPIQFQGKRKTYRGFH
jgi:hypothetical protein